MMPLIVANMIALQPFCILSGQPTKIGYGSAWTTMLNPVNIEIIKLYRVIFEEYMTPLILDKEKNGDDTDDHGAGDEDDDDQAAVHISSAVIVLESFWNMNH